MSRARSLRISFDVIPRRCDGAGRAEVEAAAAADNLRARMRAEVGGEGYVARLVEAADEVARLEHGAEPAGAVAGIGAQISLAQIRRGEERRSTGKIEHEVATGDGAVARTIEGKLGARRGRRFSELIDDELERAEMTRGRTD